MEEGNRVAREALVEVVLLDLCASLSLLKALQCPP
jgi:hypothetical protein